MNAERINTIGQLTNMSDETSNDITNIDQLLETYPDLDFKVEPEELATLTDDSSFAGYRAIRRSDSGDVLSIVKQRYTPIQNRDILEPLAEIVKENDAKFVAGGVINNGGKVWVQAELKNPMKIKTRTGDDSIQNFIIGLINHDGMGSNAILPYTSRVSCSNQFSAIKRAASGFSIRHSQNWSTRVDEARTKFNKALEYNKLFADRAQALAKVDMTDAEFIKFSLKVMPDTKPNRYAPEGRSYQNKRDTMLNLFHNGRGNIGQTRWDAFNAVTEYFDHYEGATRIQNATERGDNTRKTFERRFMNNIAGGLTNSIKHQAFELLAVSNN